MIASKRKCAWPPLACLGILLSPASVLSSEGEATAGILRAVYPVFRLTLLPETRTEKKPRFLKVEGREGMAAVPPGRYSVINWEVEAPDRQGRTWTAAGNMMPRPIEVRPGAETVVPLAAPLQAHLYTFPAAQTILFRMTYTGAMGERVREIRVDGVEAPPPWLRLLDAGGKVVEVLPFEPG